MENLQGNERIQMDQRRPVSPCFLRRFPHHRGVAATLKERRQYRGREAIHPMNHNNTKAREETEVNERTK
jgi:hypothetical protein